MNRGSLLQPRKNFAEVVAPPSAKPWPGPDLSEWDIVAHHEASHCLAYLFYGLRYRRAVIFIGDNGAVEGAVRVGVGANGHIGATKRGVICVSGACGEAKYTGVCLRDVLGSNVVAVDLEMALAALQSDPKAPPFDVVLAAAQRLVEQQWLRITRLAAELVRHHELDYEECCRIAARR